MSTKSAIVGCPPGKVPLGGGGILGGTIENTALTRTNPSGSYDRWIAGGREIPTNGNTGNWRVDVWALCAGVSP